VVVVVVVVVIVEYCVIVSIVAFVVAAAAVVAASEKIHIIFNTFKNKIHFTLFISCMVTIKYKLHQQMHCY
jgi:hypothetical protein